MAVHTGDFNAVAAQAYSPAERASVLAFIRKNGEDYDSLSDLLTDWIETA